MSKEDRRPEMVGQTYGKWRVVAVCEKRQFVRCVCSCPQGTTRDVHAGSLRSGASKSCGCRPHQVKAENLARNLMGRRFGRLVIHGYAGTEDDENLWNCRCECGGARQASTGDLRQGRVRSCGCLQKEMRASYGWNSYVEDKTDKKFGRLTARRVVGRSNAGQAMWECDCECGTEGHVVVAGALNSGEVKSCGCLLVDNAKRLFTKHGMSGTPEYRCWSGMLDRCYNENSGGYSAYGGRGITVCDYWRQSFVHFYEDMGPRPDKHSLDRVDVNGPYEKANCRWASARVQYDNTRKTIWVEHNGERLTLRQWASRLNLPPRTLYNRLLLENWPVAEALTSEKFKRRRVKRHRDPKWQARCDATHAIHVAVREGHMSRPERCERCGEPVAQAHHHNGYEPENWLDVVWLCLDCHHREHSALIEWNGEFKTRREWAEGLGITVTALCARLKSPTWTLGEALTTPKGKSQKTARPPKKRML